ncbi:hypothetical protein PENSPDRAFT_752048 [Peniophora sp. CONT]|nr:hypothetical protein PENSPDRAFT_752048 [Peniophora sp. CONT]
MRPHNLRHFSRLYSTKVFADPARETLAGTVAHHNLYIVLRTPQPMHTLSPLLLFLRMDLQRALIPLDGIVNLGYIEDNRAWTLSERLCRSYRTDLASHDSPDDVFDDELEEEERYDAVVFTPDRPPLHLRGVASSDIETRVPYMTSLVPPRWPPSRRFAPGEYDGPVHIYVCKDGGHGGELLEALKEEVKRRQSQKGKKGQGWKRVVVGEVPSAHMGGDKGVTDALIFPHGEWLGKLRTEHAPAILDALSAQPFTNLKDKTRPPLLPEHWRGRMGMTMDEQRVFIDQYLKIP